MRRTFCALCTAWVAIIRSWIVSRIASAVATHQSRAVAWLSGRASVETRWRLISKRRFSSADAAEAAATFWAGLAAALADMFGTDITSRAKCARKAGFLRAAAALALEAPRELAFAQLKMRR